MPKPTKHKDGRSKNGGARPGAGRPCNPIPNQRVWLNLPRKTFSKLVSYCGRNGIHTHRNQKAFIAAIDLLLDDASHA